MQPQHHTTANARHPRLIWRLVLASVLSVALVLVGFGHRPAQAEPQAIAYLLAGGEWADLCAKGDIPHPAGDICSACILAKAMGLPAPALTPRALVAAQPMVWTLRATARPELKIASAHPARAPPFDDHSTLL
ncbi:MAG: hypothetical protein O2994_11710 [Proteobacteria bacterium]|nr:hypothetical protein [Pseudomonadota bacterium]MDA1154593.1 hypothetical protein [Pseudomonadota bacterium]